MFSLIKLIQSLVGALHSEGTPGQLAAGIVLGSFLGLTPLVNIHNAVIFAALVLLNVSFAGGMLGWALFIPFGFLLDPLFDWIGHTLLFTPSLTPVFTSLYNMPIIPLTNFNNTVVLGSFAFAVLFALPLYLATRVGVTRYRATIGARVRQSQCDRAARDPESGNSGDRRQGRDSGPASRSGPRQSSDPRAHRREPARGAPQPAAGGRAGRGRRRGAAH